MLSISAVGNGKMSLGGKIVDAQQNAPQSPDARRPGGVASDRSLESLTSILPQLQMAVHGVLDQQAKQELNSIVPQFVQQVNQILEKYKQQGTGFSPRFQPNPNPNVVF